MMCQYSGIGWLCAVILNTGIRGPFLEGVSRTTAFTDLTVGFSDLLKKLNLFVGESFEDKPFSYYPERLLYSSSLY